LGSRVSPVGTGHDPGNAVMARLSIPVMARRQSAPSAAAHRGRDAPGAWHYINGHKE
jgi:hypothetical protein